MKNVLTWIRNNPITVVSVVVVLISLGVLGWAFMQSRSFNERLADRSGELNTIDSLRLSSVEIPPEEPDADQDTIDNVTITEAAIDQLAQLYNQMNDEYEQVFDYAINFNQRNHQPMIEDLFPEPVGTSIRFRARGTYQQAFQRMLEAPDPDEPTREPRLNAGMPPDRQDIEDTTAQAEEDILASIVGPGQDSVELTENEQEQVQREMRRAITQYLQNDASNYHVYAEVDAEPDEEFFPFQVGRWAHASHAPTDAELWEGQIELWIQQDIARAIAEANRVDDPNASVINGVVKRLNRVEVEPGYVGLHTAGAVPVLGGDSSSSSRRTFGGGRGGRGSSGDSLRMEDGGYAAPVGGMTGDPDQALPNNFYVGPTGRISNALYDVRHAKLNAVVDYQRLPEFIQALGRTNFMTVLHMDIENVDEYEAMRDGFFYGNGDAVEVNMVIETIWLRDWTEAMMPERTKRYVGIEEALEEEEQPEDEGYGAGMEGMMQMMQQMQEMN